MRGKAVTYAWKAALIYGLLLPDKEMVDTDDDDAPGGRADDGRATPIARGRNERAPCEADSTAQELTKRVLALSTSGPETLQDMKKAISTSRELGHISKKQFDELVTHLIAAKKRMGDQ